MVKRDSAVSGADTRSGARRRRPLHGMPAVPTQSTPGNHRVRLGPLPDQLGFALRRAQLTIFSSITELMSRFELKPGQYAVMVVIDQNPGLRATDVCHALGFQKANFAPLVRALEQRRLVHRDSSDRDRRTQILHLTAKGRELLQRVLKLHADYERGLRSRLGAGATRRLISQLELLAATG